MTLSSRYYRGPVAGDSLFSMVEYDERSYNALYDRKGLFVSIATDVSTDAVVAAVKDALD